ncbi:MAG: hypothetical protein J0M36_00750 [Caulobacterales bacterium]|nr:hypothetical protein [Caulobacterales bacterium]
MKYVARRIHPLCGVSVGVFLTTLGAGFANPARAQTPEDFLVQMVCVDGNNLAIFGDPVSCPNSRRKLQIGEPLPYHKIDTGNYQISDSFPISSNDGVSRAVQTYFFTSNINKDPLFPNQPFQYQPQGGYNILGADANWISYRGTSDPGSYWQPWWTNNCQTMGWRLFPNNSSAFSYGNNIHGLATYPECPSSVPTGNANLEWTLYSNYNFIVSTTDTSKNRQLDTLAGYHFSRDGNGVVGDLEISFFTQEYGATRWEAWKRDVPSVAVQAMMDERCPGVPHQDTFHGATYYMHDCRNWTTVIAPLNGVPWDPDGAAATNPNVLRWGVAPLYTDANYLQNTHQATPCSDANWAVVNSPTIIQLGTVSGAPWQHFNCVRTIKSSATPAGAYYQPIAAPPSRAQPYRFGISAWKASPANSTPSNLRVEIIQRDVLGNLVGHDMINASTIDTPRWFESTFIRASTATQVFFALYPDDANVEFAVTGAYIR